MLVYVLRRLVGSAFLILGLLTLVFFIVRLAPGDPLAHLDSPEVDPEAVAQMRHQFGFDQPLHVQYLRWTRAFLVDFDLA